MLKIIISIFIITSSIAAKEPIFIGSFKGSVRDYYPNIKIGKQFYSSNTFGFSNSKHEEITSADVKIINGFSLIAKDSCRGYYAYAISNISSSYIPFKNNSTLVYISANTICINEIK